MRPILRHPYPEYVTCPLLPNNFVDMSICNLSSLIAARCNMLYNLLVTVLYLLSVGAAPVVRGSDARPNILFLMADEMDGRILDPSSPQLKPPMPNLNALAASGALFTTAYNQAPQCVPSRSAVSCARLLIECIPV